MNQLEPIPVIELIQAARLLTAPRLGRQNGTDRAIWLAARHYTDQAATVNLPEPVVKRARELINPSEENRGNDSANSAI